MLDDAQSVIGANRRLAEHLTAYLLAAVAPRPALHPDVPASERIVAVGNAYSNVMRRLLEYTNHAGLRHYVAGMHACLRGCVLDTPQLPRGLDL